MSEIRSFDGSDPDTQDPTGCCVFIRGVESQSQWLVGQHKTTVEACGQVLPLLAQLLDHKQAFFFRKILGGYQT